MKDQYAAAAYEVSNSVDPAFTGIMISGMWFDTLEEAESYGEAAFGEYFAGVQQVAWANDKRPF